MDPKILSTMDPKLRETYERVMGATAQPASTPPAPTMPTTPASENFAPILTPTPPAPPAAAPPAESHDEQPTDTSEKPEIVSSTLDSKPDAPPTPPTTSTFDAPTNLTTPPPALDTADALNNASTAYSPDTLGLETQPLTPPASVAQEGARETSTMVRILYIIGAVVFLVVYAIFWMKIFNFQLPF